MSEMVAKHVKIRLSKDKPFDNSFNLDASVISHRTST